MSSDRFFGMYRATVKANMDPLNLGRLQLAVPGVPGASAQSWARPCISYAAGDEGFFALPPVGANMWVMFEAGNASDPIWMGGFWDQSNRPPAKPATETTKILKTSGLTVTVIDQPGAASLEIELKTGAKIVMGPQGIEIDNGKGAKIEMQGPKVAVNSGALEVI